MKKTLLLFIIVLLYGMSAKAQCPASITEPEGTGEYYLLPLSPGTCSATVTALGGVGTNILINGQNYGLTASSCAASGANNLHLEFNGVTPVVLSAQPVTISLNGSSCVYNTGGIVLPIEILSFTVQNTEGSKNHLTWATASEKDNSHFDIERSRDGNTFHNIGQVKGNNKPSSYQFTDATPPSGAGGLYYRLKQVDYDGTTTYSKVVSVEQKGKGKGLKIYPTLVSNGILTIDTEGGQLRDYSVMNLLGQQVLSGKTPPSGAGGLDVSTLSQGTYVLKVGTEVAKFVKQ